MSKEVLISMLRKGQTGNEIITILDMITGAECDELGEPTLEEIQFWNWPIGVDKLGPYHVHY